MSMVLRQDRARASLLDKHCGEPVCTSRLLGCLIECRQISPSNNFAKHVGTSRLTTTEAVSGESRDVRDGLCLDENALDGSENDAMS